jgi:thioredoxin 1
MALLTLEQHNRAELAHAMTDARWTVACLCAAWCDVCRGFRAPFEEIAARHPEWLMVWIDIEDQADLVGDLDVENFPTLLIQRGDLVAFYGPIQPEAKMAERLGQAQAERSEADLRAEAARNPERQAWQRDCNLRARLREAAGD